MSERCSTTIKLECSVNYYVGNGRLACGSVCPMDNNLDTYPELLGYIKDCCGFLWENWRNPISKGV
jgi:hypothetical protein